MEEKDLFKQLEKISPPKIEIATHKARLKSILLNRYFKEKSKGEAFSFLFKLLPAGVTLVLIGLICASLIFPKYSLARAKEIALQDPQIKEWVERGAVIKDVKIIENRAYVLVQPTKKIEEISTLSENKEIKKEEFYGALAEVNLKEKKISKIEKLAPPTISLTEQEKEKIEEITKNNPEIQKIIPKEAKIKSIQTSPPQFKLIRERNSVEALPELEAPKRASIIYQSGKNQWEGEINLSEEKVEGVKLLGEVKNDIPSEK